MSINPNQTIQGASIDWLRITAVIFALVSVFYISIAPQGANDFWLQAKVGELIVNSLEIPRTILFPFTEVSTERFNAHEWLPSVLFYFLILWSGESGLPFVLGAAGVVLFGLVTILSYERSKGNLPLALCLGFFAVIAENFRHTLRPELVSLLLMCLFLHALERVRIQNSPFAWLSALIVTAVWANTHGSFVLAPIISGAFCAGKYLDRYRTNLEIPSGKGANVCQFGYLTVLIFACTMATPFGIELWEFVITFSTSSLAKQVIIEWFPTFDPRLADIRGIRIGLLCLLLSGIGVFALRKKISTIDFLVYAIFLVLALKTGRFLVYIGIAASFTLAPALSALSTIGRYRRHWGFGLSLMLSLTTLVLSIFFGNANSSFPYQEFGNTKFSGPMVQKLSDLERSNVINSYGLGAELIYRSFPKLRPSIDSRIDSYGDDYTLFHESLFSNDNLLSEFVDRYDVKYMLLNYQDFGQVEKLSSWTNGDWSLVLADQRAVLLRRADDRSRKTAH